MRTASHTHFLKRQLSEREIEILTLTALGKTRGEIASILYLSEETIKDYIKRACDKFDVVNKTQAATYAMKLGLINPYKDYTNTFYSESD